MARNKILLLSDPPPAIHEDLGAGEVITPGHLLKRSSTDTWVKNTANADDVLTAVALERADLGQDISDNYAVADVVKAAVLVPGNRAYMFVASGDNVAKGDAMTGNNAGLLTKVGVADGNRLFVALESVDATAGAVAGTRIRVERI